MAAALASLDFVVSIDCYVNETTRHADVIFPAPSPLTKSHYDLAFYQIAIRNVVNYSPPVLPPEEGVLPEWQTMCKLALIAQGMGAAADPAIVDDLMIGTLAAQAGPNGDEGIAQLAPPVGPDRSSARMV